MTDPLLKAARRVVELTCGPDPELHGNQRTVAEAHIALQKAVVRHQAKLDELKRRQAAADLVVRTTLEFQVDVFVSIDGDTYDPFDVRIRTPEKDWLQMAEDQRGVDIDERVANESARADEEGS